MMTDYNKLNNDLSLAICRTGRLDELLDELGYGRRWSTRSSRGSIRLPCPVHGGDDLNMQVDQCGYAMPIRWTCFSHQCHREYKPSLLGLVRGVLSTRDGRKVRMGVAVDFLVAFVGDTPAIECGEWPDPLPQTRTLSLSRREVRERLVVPSPYFLVRGFSREILDVFDVGHSPKLDREVIPLYDEGGDVCIGYEARSNKPHCEQCGLHHDPHIVCGRGEPRWRGMAGFSKANYLFNYARARATTCPSVFLVEGAPDVLRLAEAGLVGVALLGSDASDSRIRMLADLGKTILVAFDNDAGGERASRRFWSKVLGQGVGRPFRPFGVPEGFSDFAEMTADEIRSLMPDFGASSYGE